MCDYNLNKIPIVFFLKIIIINMSKIRISFTYTQMLPLTFICATAKIDKTINNITRSYF